MNKSKVKTDKILAITLGALMVFGNTVTPSMADVVENSYKTGTYTGTSTGMLGEVTVKVTVDENGKISDISADGEKETPSFWEKALDVLDTIKTNNGTDNVDTISGATISSNAIINATKEAISKANDENIFDGGVGTEAKPYLISSKETLEAFRDKVNNGTDYANQYIRITQDIDLQDINWTPIGNKENPFSGVFDGANSRISNLTIGSEVEPSNNAYAGLFGYANSGASFRNINIDNVYINTKTSEISYAGAIVAFMKTDSKVSIINNCHASGEIKVNTQGKSGMVGGLIGIANQFATITSCGSNINVTLDTDSGTGNAGGLVGFLSTKAMVMNTYSNSDVTLNSSNQNSNAGGLVGSINGIIYNNYTSGSVSGSRSGGIAGNASAVSYTIGAYYTEDEAFGNSSGKTDEATLKKMSTEEITSDDFLKTLTNNLRKSQMKSVKEKVQEAGIQGLEDFEELIDRVNNKFYDWKLENSKAVHNGNIFADDTIESGNFESGQGTKEDPYIISTEDQLRNFAVSLTANLDYTDTYIELSNDITLTKEWTPIGEGEYPFNGHFDGKNHSINNLFIGSEDNFYKDSADKNARVYFGLFGVVGSKAKISNLNLDVALYVTSPRSVYVGGLAGHAQESEIDNIKVTGTIKGYTTHKTVHSFVGGIAGNGFRQKIINSSTSADVRAESLGGLAEAGGIIGLQNRGLVANCYTTGKITGTSDRKLEGYPALGGIAGVQAGTIINCYSKSSVVADCYTGHIGIIAGWSTGIGDTFQSYLSSNAELIADDKTQDRLVINPAVAIGWSAGPGVNDENEAYTGSVSLDVESLTDSEMNSKKLAEKLNDNLDNLRVDLQTGGRQETHWVGSEELASSLRTWNDDGTLSSETKKATYNTNTNKDIEALLPKVDEGNYNEGTFYGRSTDKSVVVKIAVDSNNKISAIEIVNGTNNYQDQITKIINGTLAVDDLEESQFKSALKVATNKAKENDYSTYGKASDSLFASGKGTKTDPWVISTEEQLRNFAFSINEDEDYSGKYIKLSSDITLKKSWIPAGGGRAIPFKGSFDGDNYTISNMKIGSEESPYKGKYAGLFTCVSGKVTNLKLSNIDITIRNTGESNIYAGGIAASMEQQHTDGYIDNINVTGKISIHSNSGSSYVGGIVGQAMYGTVTNSFSDVDINAVSDAKWIYGGGLVGTNARSGLINNYTEGSIKANAPINKVAIGGITGMQAGALYNCYSSVVLNSKLSASTIGGVAGSNSGIGLMLNGYCDNKNEKAIGKIVNGEIDGKGVVENVEIRKELFSKEFADILNNNLNNEELLNRVKNLLEQNWSTAFNNEITLKNWETTSNGNVVLSENSTDNNEQVSNNLISEFKKIEGAVNKNNLEYIKELITKYENLNDESKKFFDEKYKDKYETIVKTVQEIEKAAKVDEKIAKLPAKLTEKDLSSIRKIAEEYKSLNENEKGYLENTTKLQKAIKYLNQKQAEFKNSLSLNSVKYNSDTIKGKGIAGATVKAYVNGKEIGKAVVDKNGEFKINISDVDGGDKVILKMSKYGYEEVSEAKTVLRKITKFTINTVEPKADKITGTAKQGFIVKAYDKNGKQLGKTVTVGKDGKYIVKIPKQKLYNKITLKISKEGYVSEKRTITVLNVFDKTLKTNKVLSTSKKVTGKGQSGATVRVYDKNEKQIGKSVKVDKYGNYKISIPKQKKNTKLTIKMSKEGYLSEKITIAVK